LDLDSNSATSHRSNNIVYICSREVSLRLLYGIQFQIKNLTFGLKASGKKAKNLEMLAKALMSWGNKVEEICYLI
jgi:hypothetical protein